MKKVLLVLALCFSFAAVVSAQRNVPNQNAMVHEVDYEPFSTVNVSDEFIVQLITSDRYYTRITADKRLYPFVKAYVQNGTLNVTLDRKSFPSELKKELRAKGAAAPILEVEVAFPSIRTLELNDNTILHRSDVIYSNEFTLILNDKARVDKLYLDGKTAELNLYKSSYADVEAKVDENVYVNTSNTSKAVVKQAGKKLTIDTAGSSMVDAIVDVKDIELVSSGSSSTKLISGKVDNISVNASGSSSLDAESVMIYTASMEQSGSSRCYMNVTDTLKVNLTGNSQLTFKNKPYIDVDRILGSTLIKADDPKRK